MNPTTILCFGDSNTWGWDPARMERFDPGTRWTGVLAAALGAGYRVIEEGLNGRTTVFDDPLEPHRNGRAGLPISLMSHKPIDTAVIMLGTNDLKTRFSASAYDIAEGAGRLVEMVQGSDAGPGGTAPGVLLVAPPPVGDVSAFGGGDPGYAGNERAWAGAIEKSRQFAEQYARVATVHGCAFFNAADVVATSSLDGIHWEADAHRAFGAALAEVLR